MENIELIRKIDQLEESVNYLTLLVKGLAREDKPKWVSKNKAYKKYGRASVDNWIKSGLVKVYQPGGPGGLYQDKAIGVGLCFDYGSRHKNKDIN